jgi:hypothetical protein
MTELDAKRHSPGGAGQHVVSALVAKRAEVAGIIDDLERQLDQHRARSHAHRRRSTAVRIAD